MRIQTKALESSRCCLNPCCNGIYSMRDTLIQLVENTMVLILVVMEYTQ